jgi:hypothetical protein
VFVLVVVPWLWQGADEVDTAAHAAAVGTGVQVMAAAIRPVIARVTQVAERHALLSTLRRGAVN